MSQYAPTTATVSLTSGSAVVTGDATEFLANAAPTDLFVALGTAGEDLVYEIASVTDDLTLNLTAPFAGTTGGAKSFIIHRDFSPNGLPIFNRTDVALHAVLNRWSILIQNLIGGSGGGSEIDSLNALVLADVVAAADSLIIHDGSDDEAKKILVSEFPASALADDVVTIPSLDPTVSRGVVLARGGNWSSSQAEADAQTYNTWSAGAATLNTLAVSSKVFGRNTSAGDLNIVNGSASVANGITQVLAGEPFIFVWETATSVAVLTRS